jgi:RNA polymerase sigma-70 factor (ECF subfamily)
MPPVDDEELAAVVDAARAGDERAFGELVERFRPELQVHCYRMLGSLDDAEDAVQDVLLRAWRGIGRFEGRASVRTWLYRIASRACLARRTRDRRRTRLLAATTVADGVAVPLALTVPWFQAYPDPLLDAVAARDPDPASRLASRETVEIAFVTALQHLPEGQRAALVLRDVLGWPADRCATALDSSVTAVNSALQRARARLRALLGSDRDDWRAVRTASDTAAGIEERALVRRYIDAIERADDAAIAALLRPDVVVGHQPGAGGHESTEPGWYAGRDEVIAAWAPALHSARPLEMRMVEVWANRRPAVASYVRLPGTDEHRPFGLALLRLEDGLVAEVTNLTTDQFRAFGLPSSPTARWQGAPDC